MTIDLARTCPVCDDPYCAHSFEGLAACLDEIRPPEPVELRSIPCEAGP